LIALGSPEQLRRGEDDAGGGGQSQIVEVLSERAADALECLEDAAEVRHVSLYGQGLHVRVADATAAIPAISRRLREAGIPFRHVAQIPPSMEDVFLSRIASYQARQGKPGGPQAQSDGKAGN
jgi:ABC-2 type transport system ATP-binding protein